VISYDVDFYDARFIQQDMHHAALKIVWQSFHQLPSGSCLSFVKPDDLDLDNIDLDLQTIRRVTSAASNLCNGAVVIVVLTVDFI